MLQSGFMTGPNHLSEFWEGREEGQCFCHVFHSWTVRKRGPLRAHLPVTRPVARADRSARPLMVTVVNGSFRDDRRNNVKVGGGEGRLGRRRQLSHISGLIGTDKVLLEDSAPTALFALESQGQIYYD